MDAQAPPQDIGDDQPEHPQVLKNETPNFILQYYSHVLAFVQGYGWFIIIAVIVLYYLIQRFSPKYESYRRRQEEQDYLNVDPDVARRRMESMENARRRLQEQYDAQAARYAEEAKQKEEERRKEKIEDWERHQRGAGYRSKLYKPQQPEASGQASSASGPAKPKKTVYRNTDYTPLGDGASGNDSCAWRPARRGGAGGG